MSNTNAEYLGDGVYASFDGYHVWLHVGEHTATPVVVVALEPAVLKALVCYNARMQGVQDVDINKAKLGSETEQNSGEGARPQPGVIDNYDVFDEATLVKRVKEVGYGINSRQPGCWDVYNSVGNHWFLLGQKELIAFLRAADAASDKSGSKAEQHAEDDDNIPGAL